MSENERNCMLNAELYELMMETSGAVFHGMQVIRKRSGTPPPSLPDLLKLRAGFAESPAWFLVQALEFDPEPLTVELLRVRDVYGSPRIVRALLDLMTSEGWLSRDGEERYWLTEAGRAVLVCVRDHPRHLLAQLTPLAPQMASYLVALFDRLIRASLHTATPAGNWCLRHSRHRAPEGSAPILVQLQQHFADFNAFRDDAHMAAWQPQQIEGSVWEAFSLVCNGSAPSAEAMCTQLSHRGYACFEYREALALLARRGWVKTDDAAELYHPTEAGRIVRAEVEQLTDQYFYAPWSVLTDEEITEVPALLRTVQEAFSALE